MDDEMITQLRTVAFSEERKGFDKAEVREFLVEVAEWIEGGGGDVVRRRLERIAHKSANMLADAEDGAETLRREAEQETRAQLDAAKAEADACRLSAETEAREHLRDARAEATSNRDAANRYASETSVKADDYAEQTRLEAKRDSDELREESAEQARKTLRSAEQRAEQLIAEANRQREAIETVIGDLALERDAAISQVRKLAEELVETVDGFKAEPVKRRPSVPSGPIAVVEEESAEDGTAVEELRLDPDLVSHRNGASTN